MMRFRRWIGHRKLRVMRVPIFIHWSVFVAVAILALMSWDSPIHAAITITSFFAIMVIHEVGHAWVARRRRYEVHAIRLAMLQGRCEHEAAEHEWDDVAIAWGGVLAQFAVAIPMMVLMALTTPQTLGVVGIAVQMLGPVSIVIALFNLIPAPGFDGQRTWRVIPLARDWWRSRRTTKRLLRKWTQR